MIKIKFSGAALLAVFFLTVHVCAQQRAAEAEVKSIPTEPLEIKREFAPKSGTEINGAGDRADSFGAREGAKFRRESIPTRRQTYVRPTKEERLKRYVSDAFGVSALIGTTFGATVGQIRNSPREWERSVEGFGRRFASGYARNAIHHTITYGLSEAFKLENHFEKSGRKGFGKRVKHVLVESYTTRTKTGKRIPDFPNFVGVYGASAIANEAWYPDRYGYKNGLRSGTVSLGVRFGINLLREFVFRK